MTLPALREARPADHGAIRALLSEVFPESPEAELVEALRATGTMVLELVCDEGEGIAGHAAFSAMRLPRETLGLGPVAVAASARGRGTGSALVREGLARLEGQWRGVFVLGEPGFYEPLGFSAEAALPFASPYPPRYTLAAALRTGGLDGLGGPIRYARPFDEFA